MVEAFESQEPYRANHEMGSFIIVDAWRNMCHIIYVTLMRFKLRPGESIFDQVVYASKKAFISGEFSPGQPFPSIRTLAADLKIHPNTAHKVVQHLIQERWLEVRPGVGTVVAEAPPARAGDKKRLLDQEVEQLVVEAMRVGLDSEDLVEAVLAQWTKLERMEVTRR
jgi:GntR family transcriptional regulator